VVSRERAPRILTTTTHSPEAWCPGAGDHFSVLVSADAAGLGGTAATARVRTRFSSFRLRLI